MYRTANLRFCVIFLGVWSVCGIALAQTYRPTVNSNPVAGLGPDYYKKPSPSNSGSRLSLGTSGSLQSKPFSSYTPAPSVSPYLNLFREDLRGQSQFNYNTLVRPALQQQQLNQRFQQQSAEISRRLQSIAAQPKFNPQGSNEEYPTGHQTVFQYFGHYYPAPTGTRQQ